MTLIRFVKRWVRHNSIVRLWTRDGNRGHELVMGPYGETSFMDWSLTCEQGWAYEYAKCKVLYLADILCDSYPEAINIVIEVKKK